MRGKDYSPFFFDMHSNSECFDVERGSSLEVPTNLGIDAMGDPTWLLEALSCSFNPTK